MVGVGRRRWLLPGGFAPSQATGPEPAFTSFERLAVLNTGTRPAALRIRVFHKHREPLGPFRLSVAPRRVRAVRAGDLIFPAPVELDLPFGLLIESDEPVVVQATRQDTRQAANALAGSIAFPAG